LRFYQYTYAYAPLYLAIAIYPPAAGKATVTEGGEACMHFYTLNLGTLPLSPAYLARLMTSLVLSLVMSLIICSAPRV
jgi:hypothetical protein